MITSALIQECRRAVEDWPKSTQSSRLGDGTTTLFNLGKFPIIEKSFTVYKNTSALTSGGVAPQFTLDLDNGDLNLTSAATSAQTVKANFKYAEWRDQQWNEAIGNAIEALNARGFFKQVVRNTSVMSLSANIKAYSGPSACIDLYEVLESDDYTTSGSYVRLGVNWSYQQDANKLVLGEAPSRANHLAVSYLRRLQKYNSTSATLDVLTDWLELVKKKATAEYFKSLAAKIAKQGNATIEDGHISFTNLRTLARDLEAEFNLESLKAKPTRPAKSIQYHIEGGGEA